MRSELGQLLAGKRCELRFLRGCFRTSLVQGRSPSNKWFLIPFYTQTMDCGVVATDGFQQPRLTCNKDSSLDRNSVKNVTCRWICV
ncbi:hypothetical protein NPIL_343601 [Nephila pilipes]|uniref:Uncharacterized protein n=1 Tax=Nephila pilipes TaxID=299642 RepID=A0A8X6NSN0_NEPPI|nr:hypothetical protein NPIL_343601 [Nephila pilipes]